jgi:hypothetical protein
MIPRLYQIKVCSQEAIMADQYNMVISAARKKSGGTWRWAVVGLVCLWGLGAMPGTDLSGYSGFEDKVD